MQYTMHSLDYVCRQRKMVNHAALRLTSSCLTDLGANPLMYGFKKTRASSHRCTS